MKKISFGGAVLLFLLTAYWILWQLDFSPPEGMIWGISFSNLYVEQDLGLEWEEVYGEILRFPAKKLRLATYWNRIEKERGVADFSEVDFELRAAARAGKEVMLVLGLRTPRWPECHAPEWTRGLTQAEFEDALLGYLEKLVLRYKASPALTAWQVENEPFLKSFGDCPRSLSRSLLQKEIAFVKSLNSSRPVMVTDSGELSLWLRAGNLGDWFGTTLYRVVWNKFTGFLHYVYPPSFYTARAWFIEKLFGTERVLISELQAEPWAKGGGAISRIPFEAQTEGLALEELKKNLEFARKTGISEAYLWGVEWWYWRKVHGDPTFWEFGKELFNAM